MNPLWKFPRFLERKCNILLVAENEQIFWSQICYQLSCATSDKSLNFCWQSSCFVKEANINLPPNNLTTFSVKNLLAKYSEKIRWKMSTPLLAKEDIHNRSIFYIVKQKRSSVKPDETQVGLKLNAGGIFDLSTEII